MPKRFHIGYTVLGTIEVVATNEDEAREMVLKTDPKVLLEDSEFTFDYTMELRDGY
mgnify:CR=1 FL=1